MTSIAFLNLPFWELRPIPGHPDQNYLVRGFRHGPNGPYQEDAKAPFGTANRPKQPVAHPLKLQNAFEAVSAALPEITAIFRDSVDLHEDIKEFNAWWVATVPSHVVIETTSLSWPNDLKFIKAMKVSNHRLKIAVFGWDSQEARSQSGTLVDAWIVGDDSQSFVRFAKGEQGILGEAS